MRKFGTCCKDLADSMTLPPQKFFRVEDTGILYLTVGYVVTEKGPGFYDQAVIFCLFCGPQLQTKEQIADAASGA